MGEAQASLFLYKSSRQPLTSPLNGVILRHAKRRTTPNTITKMKTITHTQLRDLIANTKGNQFVQVLSKTDAKALKTGNPYGTIFKIAAASVSVGTDYEKAVNRVAAKEGNPDAGTFKAESIWGGKGVHEIPNKIIQHVDSGKRYLYCQTSEQQITAFPPKVEYVDSLGNTLTHDQVKDFLPKKAPSAKQADFGNHNERNVRMIAFESLRAIAIGGEVYTVV
jgi:hypothetical protein